MSQLTRQNHLQANRTRQDRREAAQAAYDRYFGSQPAPTAAERQAAWDRKLAVLFPATFGPACPFAEDCWPVWWPLVIDATRPVINNPRRMLPSGPVAATRPIPAALQVQRVRARGYKERGKGQQQLAALRQQFASHQPEAAATKTDQVVRTALELVWLYQNPNRTDKDLLLWRAAA